MEDFLTRQIHLRLRALPSTWTHHLPLASSALLGAALAPHALSAFGERCWLSLALPVRGAVTHGPCDGTVMMVPSAWLGLGTWVFRQMLF